ncbi:hypothetical protein HY485_02435 [Candidatus Woesearchaeota archaeon]|nr:hypothetical protein [Candidatus Woesearchaeota archaeon]
MTETSGNLGSFTKEQIESLNWDRIARESVDILSQLKESLKPAYFILGKELLAKHLINNKEWVLHNVLVPLQGFLIEHGVLDLVLKNPKCLNHQKSDS